MSEFDLDAITPTVLIIDEEFRTDLYGIWLSDVCTVKTASSRVEALTELEPSVAVVLLRHELLAEVKSDVESRMQTVSPTARLVVTTSNQRDPVLSNVESDTTMREPITREKLRTEVKKQATRAFYHEALRQYYRITIQSTSREMKRAGKRTEPDAEGDGLREGMEDLKELLEEIDDRLDFEDKRAILESLRPPPAFPSPSGDSEVRTGKYVPDKCRNCGLEWGRDYGRSIGLGYVPVGAFTWRCTECKTIQHIPNPSNRSIARRDF